MKIEIYEEKKDEGKLKPIKLQLRYLRRNSLDHPYLVCVNESGNYVCGLLYFHVGRGGMHPIDGSKQTLMSAGYDISGLQFDDQGAIRFKVNSDWEIKEKSNPPLESIDA